MKSILLNVTGTLSVLSSALTRSVVSSCFLMLALLLNANVAFSDDTKMDGAVKAESRAAAMFSDPYQLKETAKIERLMDTDAKAKALSTKVFDANADVVLRKSSASKAATKKPSPVKIRKAYFGDLHVHTDYSFDAYAFGTVATPYDAYRFAKGEAIKNPAGFDMQLTRPMDFYAVTDHAMFLGLVKASSLTSTDFSKTDFAEPYHGMNDPDKTGMDPLSILMRAATFATFLTSAVEAIMGGELERSEVLSVVRSAWADTVDAAEQYNDPGHFTTFVAYEYTTTSADFGNLHRNVIFEGSEKLPLEPFSRFHSVNPEDLWSWMDDLRTKGVESLAIPHNSNGSNGQMFKLEDWAGNPLDDEYTKKRIRNEPIVEITQIKGTSETHPLISSRDEWADFEIMPYRIASMALSKPEGSYVRNALLRGLALEQQGLTNPYQFGFIGSSDTHNGASQNDESTFVSKLGLMSGTEELRGSVPYPAVTGEVIYQSTKIGAKLVKTPMGSGVYKKIDGKVYSNSSGTPMFGASGLAAAWAEENTRESLYAAFRRKETYATSGPRMQLRFFAGYDFDSSMVNAVDGVAQAYAKGVSMGGELAANESSPGFLIMAAADPQGTPLQRLQVIKGWVDAAGETHEDVIDVACAGGAKVDAKTKRCPDNGAKVDLADCSTNAETGSAQLNTLWHDPEFDSKQRAFYYARVLENPTCRWSTWDANRRGVALRSDLAATLQERAWSSPIHYMTKK